MKALQQKNFCIFANLKMNQTLPEAQEYLNELNFGLGELFKGIKEDQSKAVRPIISLFPQAPLLSTFLSHPIKNSLPQNRLSIGAQVISSHTQGAFTGEVSGALLGSMGVEFALVGHSERRKLFQENDQEILIKKIKEALDHHIIPVFCLGESLDDRNQGKTKEVLRRQFELLKNPEVLKSLKGFISTRTSNQKNLIYNSLPLNTLPLIIAYEPIWSIGTGLNATVEQIKEAHRELIALCDDLLERLKKTNEEISDGLKSTLTHGQLDKVLLLYGGSVTQHNAHSISQLSEVDGLLVGGASLKSASFLELIRQALLNLF